MFFQLIMINIMFDIIIIYIQHYVSLCFCNEMIQRDMGIVLFILVDNKQRINLIGISQSKLLKLFVSKLLLKVSSLHP